MLNVEPLPQRVQRARQSVTQQSLGNPQPRRRGLNNPRRRRIDLGDMARPELHDRGAKPTSEKWIFNECDSRRRQDHAARRHPRQGQTLALLCLNARHPFNTVLRLAAMRTVRRSFACRRRAATSLMHGHLGRTAVVCPVALCICLLIVRLLSGGRHDEARGRYSVLPGPSQFFLHRHAAARPPTLVGGTTATVVMLAGKRPRFVDDVGFGRQWKARGNGQVCGHAQPYQREPERLRKSGCFRSRAHGPMPRPTARSSSESVIVVLSNAVKGFRRASSIGCPKSALHSQKSSCSPCDRGEPSRLNECRWWAVTWPNETRVGMLRTVRRFSFGGTWASRSRIRR